MGSLGMQEIIVIFLIALIIFGPRKLPELGKTIGKGLAEFKKASNELKQTWEDEVRLDKEKEVMSETAKEVIPEPVKDTTIQPTEIQPTEIQPTEIQPSEIQPSEIQPSEMLNENSTPAESKENQ
jgi:TatA/E family protein of Tat protein translocase